jgi:hypothetical protein
MNKLKEDRDLIAIEGKFLSRQYPAIFACDPAIAQDDKASL